MNNHLQALAVKLGMIFVILSLFLWLPGLTDFFEVLLLSLALTVIAYLLGDLFILPRLGNWVATVSDGLLTFLTLWAAQPLMAAPPPGMTTLIWSSVAVAAGEYFFHRYFLQSPVT